MSCFEQISLAIGDMAVLMSLSVVSSVHCCMVISGTDPPLSTFISHSPALRTGSSTATGAHRQQGKQTNGRTRHKKQSSHAWAPAEFFHAIVLRAK